MFIFVRAGFFSADDHVDTTHTRQFKSIVTTFINHMYTKMFHASLYHDSLKFWTYSIIKH